MIVEASSCLLLPCEMVYPPIRIFTQCFSYASLLPVYFESMQIIRYYTGIRTPTNENKQTQLSFAVFKRVDSFY